MRVRKRSNIYKQGGMEEGLSKNSKELVYHAKLIGSLIDKFTYGLDEALAIDFNEEDRARVANSINELIKFKEVVDSEFNNILTQLKGI